MLSHLHLRGVTVALVFTLLAALAAHVRWGQDRTLELVVTLQATAVDRVQLFYDVGRGFNEQDSVVRRLRAEQQLESLRFPLPDEPLLALRLDPLDRPGQVVIQAIQLTRADGDPPAELRLDEIRPLHQVATLEPTPEGLAIRTVPDANDPYLLLPVPPSSPEPERSRSKTVGIVLLVSLAALFLLGIRWRAHGPNLIELLGARGRGDRRLQPRTYRLLTALAVFATVLGGKLVLIAACGSDLPYWDQWNGEGAELYRPYLVGEMTWEHLLRPHNEHRILFTRLLALALLEWNGQWDALLQMVVNAGLHALILAGIVVLVGRWLSPAGTMLSAAAIALFFCVPFAWENTLAGFQSQFYFLLLFSLVHLAGTALTRPGSRASWSFQLAGIAALFGMASGLASPAAAIGLCVLRRLRERTWRSPDLALIVFNLLVLAAGWELRGQNPAHVALQAKSVADFVQSMMYLLTWPSGSPLMAVLVVGALLGLLVRWWRSSSPLQTVLLAWAGWWFAQLIILAYGRGAANAVYSGRYLDIVALGHVIVLFGWLDWVAQDGVRWRRRLASGAGLAWGVAIIVGLWQHTRPHAAELWRIQPGINVTREAVVRDYLLEHSPSFFQRVPHVEIPFPHAGTLASYLDDPVLRDILPPSVRLPLPLAPAEPAVGFRRRAVPPELVHYRDIAWGSFPAMAGSHASFHSMPITAATPHVIVQLTGSGGELHLDATEGTDETVTPSRATAWAPQIFRPAGEPFALAATAPADAWLAFSAPREIGTPSVYARRLIALGQPLGLAGCLALLLLAGGRLPEAEPTQRES